MTASVTQDKLQFSFSTLLKPWGGTVPNQKFAIQTPYQVQEFLLFYCRKTSTFFSGYWMSSLARIKIISRFSKDIAMGSTGMDKLA